MFETIYAQIATAIILLACGFALWKGDRLEQTGAIVYLLGWLITNFAQSDTGDFTPQHLWLVIDTSVLAIFGFLAWKSQRSWPMFAAAFQSIAVAVHISSLLDLEIGERAYIAALAISGYGLLATIAVGTWVAWRERKALTF